MILPTVPLSAGRFYPLHRKRVPAVVRSPGRLCAALCAPGPSEAVCGSTSLAPPAPPPRPHLSLTKTAPSSKPYLYGAADGAVLFMYFNPDNRGARGTSHPRFGWSAARGPHPGGESSSRYTSGSRAPQTGDAADRREWRKSCCPHS